MEVARQLEEESREGVHEFVPRICRQMVVVDQARIFPDVVIAGRFGQVDPRILSGAFRFSGNGIAEYEWKIFKTFPPSTLEQAEKLIQDDSPDNPWAPAGTAELLCFAEQVPHDEQRDLIVAPRATALISEPPRPLFNGSKGEEETALHVMHVFGSAPVRILGLSKVVGVFPSGFSFLGVRKLPGPCHSA